MKNLAGYLPLNFKPLKDLVFTKFASLPRHVLLIGRDDLEINHVLLMK